MLKVLQRKLVVVGDGACGKTSLLLFFNNRQFHTAHIPTVFENTVKDFEVDGQHVELALYDTAGQEDYDRLRPLAYPDTHVVLICFSVDIPDSLDNVKEKWVPEILEHCPNVPYLLVACKKDARDDPDVVSRLASMSETPITYEQGLEMSSKISATGYVECSAKTGENVDDVFTQAVRATAETDGKKKKEKCLVM
ncbi:hypothetical protein LRAMOSA04851 [Lichtheimia ramosa]|uniref:GTP-binding protein rhoA n=1 Tax=Lichtheimia ramosa TaxID=688394 RepID=A0A077WZD8_9FUNG|nr:hypothetical protein LRAMOSA04851 [Lichtheimia ramosa]